MIYCRQIFQHSTAIVEILVILCCMILFQSGLLRPRPRQNCVVASWLTVRKQQYSQENTRVFDEKLLEHLVCPLSKKDLRYDKENNELVCDELGVAYPIVNGIPNLVPQDARMIKKQQTEPEKKTS